MHPLGRQAYVAGSGYLAVLDTDNKAMGWTLPGLTNIKHYTKAIGVTLDNHIFIAVYYEKVDDSTPGLYVCRIIEPFMFIPVAFFSMMNTGEIPRGQVSMVMSVRGSFYFLPPVPEDGPPKQISPSPFLVFPNNQQTFPRHSHLGSFPFSMVHMVDWSSGFGVVLNGYCLGTNRTYLIKRDLFSGLKGGEFTVYDNQGKITLFRMESKFAILHNIRIFKGLNKKQNPIALLKAKLSFVLYKGTIAIFNKNSNEWKNGTIEQNFKIVGNKFTIKYNNTEVSMEGKAASLDTTFIDQSNKQVLAKFHKRVSSLFWRNKYDLQVLSDKLPDQVYFLGIAARDINNNRIQTG
ncbi:unnamed protein product [Adineta steineri]|uniref:Uncharacterized protein n=1 Tax=Adineta steineri TaxID=433720 RepID=A0A819JU75_9BILA|nr:unnamed protein product [Adineta steineri]